MTANPSYVDQAGYEIIKSAYLCNECYDQRQVLPPPVNSLFLNRKYQGEHLSHRPQSGMILIPRSHLTVSTSFV